MLTVPEYRSAVRHLLSRFDRRAYCPHCRHFLGGWLHPLYIVGPPAIMVATSRCTACGEQVLADPEEPLDAWPRLPTRDEYRIANDRYQNRGVLLIGTCVLGGVTGCVGSIAGLMDFVAMPHGLKMLLTVLGTIGPPFMAFPLLWVMSLRARWDESLACGWCGEALAGQAETVLTSGRCCFCGRTAFDDDPPEPKPEAGRPSLTRGEIAARAKARSRAATRGLYVGAAMIAIAAAVLYAPLVIFEGFDGLRLWLSNQFGWQNPHDAIEMGFVAVLVTTMIAVILVIGWCEWRAGRRYPIVCPSCKQSLYLPLAIAAGRCNQCYQPVVADLLPAG